MRLVYVVSLILIFISCSDNTVLEENGPVKVEIRKEKNGFRIYCDGEPFYIKGAGFEGSDPSSVAKYGGNAIRTWRTGDEFITGKEILDEAHRYGLKVCLGLEIGRERHGFDYDDENQIAKQLAYVRGEVVKYRNHPALLAWGIGNELNLHYTNKKLWVAVNEIAELIKELDPMHPTTTMLAGAGEDDVRSVLEYCPALDYLSFQLYGDIVNLPAHLKASNYDGPYVITEWGATGHWEVGKTSWDRPIEQNSHEKANSYQERYESVIAADNHCMGSFVFLWGQKQERTPTWYGMFLESGDKTESVDIMQYVWTGDWPENRSPQINSFTIRNSDTFENHQFTAGERFEVFVNATDPDNDELEYQWEILEEVPVEKQSDGGDFEARPFTVFKKVSVDNEVEINAPQKAGEYRLFVYISDSNGSAATANIPFLVK